MDAATAPLSHGAPRTRADLAKLAVAALGVVYGDIGTSPLYAIKECFAQHNDALGRPLDRLARSDANVLGILSLVFWSLVLVIVVKYLTFIMRADNEGEGGILALLALVAKRKDGKPRGFFLIALGLFGAALLYGDGIITPAISVLSAIEGLAVHPLSEAAQHVAEPGSSLLDNLVVPLTVLILVGLFVVQKRGTARVGYVFGPAMVLWFSSIATIGFAQVVRHPRVLLAVLPTHAVLFLAHHGTLGFFILGSVVLCITGGEALYADMGHFGRGPIKWAWYGLVLPALMMNYFGQGAVLLSSPAAIQNPFYALAPAWFHYPLVAIATVATVIASQALITGAYSLTQQAVQLGYWPRVTIKHTSDTAEGQIYMPEINYMLMVACVALVLGFKHSDALAAAYGIAVTGTMSITTILFFVLIREKWNWSMGKALALCGLFLGVDLLFFVANTVKLAEGGWVPLGIAAFVFTIMVTWKRGRIELGKAIAATTLPLQMFLDDLERTNPHRVKGTAVFMTSNPDVAPPVLLHHFKHNKVLHEQVVCLSINTHHVPEVPPASRLELLRDCGHGVWQVRASYGFMQAPSAPEVMERCRERGLVTNVNDTSFFLGRETLVTTDKPGMARWRKVLFAFLSRNARPATAFFQIPPNRVVEFGAQIEL